MAHTAPVVGGRVRPKYRFNVELPDELGEWLDGYSEREGVAKTRIIQHELQKIKRRDEKTQARAA